MKAIIGVVANVEEKEFLPNSYMYQYSLNSSYLDAVRKAGGIPVMLPISNENNIEEYISLVDGILLAGGRDVNPKLYNEKIEDATVPVIEEKDKSDILYVRTMMKKKKPIFGICRGMQIINVALGGSLYQDLELSGENKKNHFNLEKPFNEIHLVEVEENTLLNNVLGDRIKVNSIHHQSIKDLAEDLKISARALDGTIEAVENEKFNIFGVQWHPELLLKGGKTDMLLLFEEFIKVVEKSKENKIG